MIDMPGTHLPTARLVLRALVAGDKAALLAALDALAATVSLELRRAAWPLATP